MQQAATDQSGAIERTAKPSQVHIWSHGADVPFLLDRPQGRLQGSIGLSLLAHFGVALIFLFASQILPEPTRAIETPRNLQNYNIVWLPEPGPGGGGGGGGNRSPEPPRAAELPGKERLTVPVAKPPELENPKPKDEPTPEQQLNIPAQSMASAEQILPGVLEGLPSTDVHSQGLGIGGGGGTGTGTGIGPGTGPGLGPGTGGGVGGGAYRPGSGIELPRVVREVKPLYTADAMRAKIQGTVWLEAIVLPDGTVGKVDVVRSLDSVFGLDQEAIKAARQWRFVPGRRLGEPVAVIVTIELTFTLR
jgi:TonB family protein